MQRPAIPAPPHAGGCLCGAVRYRLNARPLAVNACHCTDCKKLTGTTNLLMVLAPRDAFTQTGATERFRKRADSGNEVDIVRCAKCGVRLWHEALTAPQLIIVAVGTLDDPTWAIPTSHIWVKRASPGVAFQDDALIVQGGPTDRRMLFDAFDRIYPT